MMRGAGGSQLLGWVGKMWRASSQTREGSFCRRLIRRVTVHLTKDVLGDLGRALTYEKGFKKPKNSQRGTVQADEITEVCWPTVGLLGQVIGIAKKKSRAISVTTQY